MAPVFPIGGPSFVLQPAQNGNILVAGNTSDENPNGAVRFWFIPDVGCDAVFTVMGRPPRLSTADGSVPWVPIPYRRITLNNAASDYAIVSDNVSGVSSILVPTVGGQVGLFVTVTTGNCTICKVNVNGATSP